MRRVASNAAVCLYWRVFIHERPLLVRMTFNARSVSACCESGLFKFKAAVRVMAIAAPHRPFENFMVERQVKLVFRFGVAAYTKLRLIHLQEL